jgi:hypothetical protein
VCSKHLTTTTKICLHFFKYEIKFKSTLFGKEVGFEVGSDSKVGFLFPTYIFLLINHYMSVSDVGIKRAVRAKLNM